MGEMVSLEQGFSVGHGTKKGISFYSEKQTNV